MSPYLNKWQHTRLGQLEKHMLLVQISPSDSLLRKENKKKTKYDISRVHTPTRAHLFWTHCSWVWHDSGKSQKGSDVPFFAPITHQESLLHLNWQLVKTKFSLPSRQIVKRSGSFDTDSNIFPIVSLKTLGKKMPTRHFTVIWRVLVRFVEKMVYVTNKTFSFWLEESLIP